MKKIGNVILAAIMVAALVFGFASCKHKTEEEEPPVENNEFITSADGRFSYKIKDGIFYLNYTGNENPILKIDYLQADPNSENEYWPWEWLWSDKDLICKKEMQFDIFKGFWPGIARKWGETGECTKETNFGIYITEQDGTKDGKNILDKIIEIEIKDLESKISESKDYSKKTFTPKTMTFTEENAKNAVVKMKMSANLSNHLECFPGMGDTEDYARNYSANNKDLPPAIWETALGEKELTHEHIKHLKNLGFTGIRIPVTWGWHLDRNDNIFPGWMNRVQEVVDWCMEEDLYVILNTHHDSGERGKNQWLLANDNSYNQYNARYKKIWQQISERFKGYSEKLIFATANEVTEDVSPDFYVKNDAAYQVMAKWNQLFVDTVRASGGNNAKRNLVVSGPYMLNHDFDGKMTLPNDSVSNHLIYEVHCYEPWSFCGGDGGGVDSSNMQWDVKYEGKALFDAGYSFDETWVFSKENNIPVIIGEWGVQDADRKIVPDAERVKYAKDFVPAAMERGFATFIWGPFWFFGYDDNSNVKYPNYYAVIKDCVQKTSFDTLKAEHTPLIKNLSGGTQTSHKAFGWDFATNTQSTTEYSGYYVEYDITSLFGGTLPKKDENVCLIFQMQTKQPENKTILYDVYLIDNSNGWCEMLGTPEDRIKLNVQYEWSSVYRVVKVKNAPSEKVLLRIEYSKADYDGELNINIVSNFAPN